jgi:pilus assembly protein Flp/PilA
VVIGRAGGVSDLPPPARKLKEYPMSKFVSRFLKDESGATAIEYGLIAALVAVAIAAVLPTLGGKLTNTFGNVANKLP